GEPAVGAVDVTERDDQDSAGLGLFEDVRDWQIRTVIGLGCSLPPEIVEPIQLLGLASVDAPDETLGVAQMRDATIGPDLPVAQLGEAEDAGPMLLRGVIIDLPPGNGVDPARSKVHMRAPAAPFAVVRAQPEPVFGVKQVDGRAEIGRELRL